MAEKTLSALKPEDHSTQLLSGGELSVENTNVVQHNTGHTNISALANNTTFSSDDFDKYLKFPTILFEGTLGTNTNAGALLYASEVSPTILKATKLTRVANIASNFLQWNGDLVIRIIFTKAIFMQTKIIAAFLPTAELANVDKVGVIDMYGCQYHAVMNPDNDNELSFVIPFISGKNWHTMRESTGLFLIRLFQPLVTSMPSGTQNATVPFTMTVSSTTNSPNRPLAFRYLIAPTTVNSTIIATTNSDFATTISPQIDDDSFTPTQPDALVPFETVGNKRIRTGLISPTDVNVLYNDNTTGRQVRTLFQNASLATAIYGYGTQLPGVSQPMELTNFDIRPPYTDRTYTDYKGNSLSQVQPSFSPLIFNIYTLQSAGMYWLSTFPLRNQVFGFSQFADFRPGFQGTGYAFGYSGSGTKQFSLGIRSPYMIIDPELLSTLNVLPACMRVNINGLNNPAYLDNVVAQATHNEDGVFIYYFTGRMTVDFPVQSGVQFSNASSNAFQLATPILSGTSSMQINAQLRVNALKRGAIANPYAGHVLAFSCCNTDLTEASVAAGNYSNIVLENSAMLTAAIGGRAASQLTESGLNRVNPLQVYMVLRKGTKILANITAYLDSLFTFVDGFLPPGTDPENYDFRNDTNFYAIPFDDGVPVVLQAVQERAVLTRYEDNTIKKIPMIYSADQTFRRTTAPRVVSTMIPLTIEKDEDEKESVDTLASTLSNLRYVGTS